MTSGSFSVECQSNIASFREHTPMPGVGKQGCLMARGIALLGNRPSPHARTRRSRGAHTHCCAEVCFHPRPQPRHAFSPPRGTSGHPVHQMHAVSRSDQHQGRLRRPGAPRSATARAVSAIPPAAASALTASSRSAATARTNHGRPRDPLLATRCGPAPLGSPMPAPPEPNSRIRRPTSARSPAQSFHHLRDDHHDLGELLSTAQMLLNARSQPD